MEIECTFQTSRWDKKHDLKYFCIVKSVKVVTGARRIKVTSGNHLTDKSDNDVEAVELVSKNLESFPRGFHLLFPNLTGLKVENCGLKSISRRDLIGLENLTDLYLQRNQITTLSSDLFIDMRRLKYFSIRENHLEFVNQSFFAPLIRNGMYFVDFRKNKLVDSFFGISLSKCPNETLEQLIKLITESCTELTEYSENYMQTLTRGVAALWISGRYSDFVINVESKKFRVHKNILALQSSVFAKMFDVILTKKERQEPFILKIQDFNARTVEEFLRFIYTGQVEDYANAMELFAISSKYKVDELSKICTEVLIAQLDISNAFKTFHLSHQFLSDSLRQAAFEEIKLLFPGNSLDETLIDEPKRLKELIDAKFYCDALLEKASKSENKMKD